VQQLQFSGNIMMMIRRDLESKGELDKYGRSASAGRAAPRLQEGGITRRRRLNIVV